MPWALLIRLATRLAMAGLIGRGLFRGRAPVFTTPGQPGPSRPTATSPGVLRARHLLVGAAEAARLAWRVIATMMFVAGALVLVSVGVTCLAAGVRILGFPLLVLAAASGLAALWELRGLMRLRAQLRRRILVDEAMGIPPRIS